MIHWLFVLYCLLLYTYTGHGCCGVSILRGMLLFICGAFENLIWVEIFEMIMKFKKKKK